MSKRLSMRKIREILRLKWSLGLSNREIANSVKASPSTIGDCLRRAIRANLTWPLPIELNDKQIENIHKELKRKGVTRELLGYEYKQQHPQVISYSRFCDLYRQWLQKIDSCMRQNYKSGQYMFVDYAGLTIPIITNVNTGESGRLQQSRCGLSSTRRVGSSDS